MSSAARVGLVCNSTTRLSDNSTIAAESETEMPAGARLGVRHVGYSPPQRDDADGRSSGDPLQGRVQVGAAMASEWAEHCAPRPGHLIAGTLLVPPIETTFVEARSDGPRRRSSVVGPEDAPRPSCQHGPPPTAAEVRQDRATMHQMTGDSRTPGVAHL